MIYYVDCYERLLKCEKHNSAFTIQCFYFHFLNLKYIQNLKLLNKLHETLHCLDSFLKFFSIMCRMSL